jgi:ABC-type transport system involved in cytochrome bd biosynthesis fused ATPase/permease subunit
MVQKAVDDILKSGEKTMIIIAHRLSTVINCKKILVFQKGKIVEEGTHEELLAKNGVYTTLVKTQLTHQPEKNTKVQKEQPKKVKRIHQAEEYDDSAFKDEI